jgi:hypothetical protein
MKTLVIRAALLVFPLATAFPALGQEELRIGKITIESYDVFTPEEATHGWVYQTANALHIATKPSVIRDFLLFHEGDLYVPTRLEETERNLRALPFIKSASVVAAPPHDGVVDVLVRTQDSWTTQPGVSLGKSGGVTTYSFSLEEKDLLGLGRQAALAYGKDTQRINRSVEYKDPSLFGPYWSTELIYANNSDGVETTGSVGRPFVSFVSPWAADALGSHLTQNERIFENGTEVSIFSQDHRAYQAHYGWALAAGDRRARRLTVGFENLQDTFTPLPDHLDEILPENRLFRYLLLRYEDVANDFIKLNYVNRDSRYEDFNLGLTFGATFGVSPAAFGLDRTTEFVQAETGYGWRFSPGRFLLAHVSFQTRLDGGLRNGILSGTASYVRKFETSLIQTFVSRIRFDYGWNLDRDVQFFADGDNGLRGYRLYSFEGNKRIILNLEHRIFTGKEILQLGSFGAAVFFDTGTATPEGTPLKLSEFKSDVGIGLRVLITRAAGNSILRVDMAYALNPDPFGRKGWLVSFSSGQSF